MAGQLRQQGVGDGADAGLDRGAVGDPLGHQRADAGVERVRLGAGHGDEGVVGLAPAGDLGDVHQAAAERARHPAVREGRGARSPGAGSPLPGGPRRGARRPGGRGLDRGDVRPLPVLPCRPGEPLRAGHVHRLGRTGWVSRRSGASLGRPRRGPRRAVGSAGEAGGHLVVGGLGTVDIELTNRPERLGRLEGDELVGVTVDPCGPVGRRHRHGQHDPGRWPRANWPAARAVDPVAMPSSTTTAVRPVRSKRGRWPRKRRARRSSSARSRASTAASSCADTPVMAPISRLMIRTPSSPMAPMPSSGWYGTPSLRTTITSSGAPSAWATSKATGTPPRGSPRTTRGSPRRCASLVREAPPCVHAVDEAHAISLRPLYVHPTLTRHARADGHGSSARPGSEPLAEYTIAVTDLAPRPLERSSMAMQRRQCRTDHVVGGVARVP